MKFINILSVGAFACALSLGSAMAVANGDIDGYDRSMNAAQKFRENQERIHGKDKSEVKTSNKKADTASEQVAPKRTEPSSKD
ncbi:hypothetical protein [Stutzerimonas stutzeri]|jgi:hypothetical protein|uniref:Secreted protein n=1 Tax=Stutzerimonas stutzeri TaxID=316 RepID=A0A172WJZ5_STUST|nr:hypothetical protein [Stutzerimonas stutzeri]ANF23774.1 hypothetical protein PS273GM_00760 [Stutzerimonas stutzeri]|tara:strand:- start:207 stop:455 length:249 start_codon:yes stop_codon:yes gene_type:complete